MSKTFAVSVLMLAVGTLVTAFQNCGGVKFNQTESSSAARQSASSNDVPNGSAGATANGDCNGNCEGNVAAAIPSRSLEDASAACDLLPSAGSTSTEIRLVQGVANVADIVDVGRLNLIGITGDVRASSIGILSAENIAGALSVAATRAAVLDVKGAACLNISTELLLLQNIKGTAVVRGNPAQRTKVRGVLDTHDLQISDADVDVIQNVHGRLVLVRSNVALVRNISGRIDLREGSSLGNVPDGAPVEIYRDGVRVN